MIEMEIKKTCEIHERTYLIVDSVKVFIIEFGSYRFLRLKERDCELFGIEEKLVWSEIEIYRVRVMELPYSPEKSKSYWNL